MGLHRFLRLDSVLSKPYSEEDIERLENFAEEIANEKMTGTFTLPEFLTVPKNQIDRDGYECRPYRV